MEVAADGNESNAMVAEDIAEKNRKSLVPSTAETADGEQVQGILATDRAFQFGFEHLAKGFRAEPPEAASFAVFDQWVEVLPTDQIVAVEVEYDPKTGRMI